MRASHTLFCEQPAFEVQLPTHAPVVVSQRSGPQTAPGFCVQLGKHTPALWSLLTSRHT